MSHFPLNVAVRARRCHIPSKPPTGARPRPLREGAATLLAALRGLRLASRVYRCDRRVAPLPVPPNTETDIQKEHPAYPVNDLMKSPSHERHVDTRPAGVPLSL